MTDKIWTATDIEMGVMRLSKEGYLGDLYITQGYAYKDSNGDIIEDLPQKTYTTTVAMSSLSQDMQTAIIMLFNYVYQQALINEGMN